ncbi:MAG: hypothetical protein WD467_02620 [Candidatus Saccharimonadales bacterium]
MSRETLGFELTNDTENDSLDGGHLSVVNGQFERGTYVATPVWVGNYVVFPYKLSPELQPLFKNFQPAPLSKYADVESFVADERPADDRPGTLNFMAYFQPARVLTGGSHKIRSPFRRLLLLNPKLVHKLEQDLADTYRYDSIAKLEPQPQTRLFEAYNLMSEMVDINDENLFRTEPDGTSVFDRDYLKR